MTENKTMRIELLKDEKGIYGLGAEGLPENWKHLKSIITRPDRVVYDDRMSDAALQMVPDKALRNSAENRFIEALTESWGTESAKKLGLDRLSPKYYFALRGRCRRIVNSLLYQALAVANQEYLRTARRYSLCLRLPIYNACCFYGERVNQIANTFALAAIVGYTTDPLGEYPFDHIDSDRAAMKAKRDKIRELVQNGARLGLIAEALKLPKAARHIWPANVYFTPSQSLQLNPAWLFYMPKTIHKQRRWLYALDLASRCKFPTEFQYWIARHVLELNDSRGTIQYKLGDISDWITACRDKANVLELEKLNGDFKILVKKAQALGKTTRVKSLFKPNHGTKFVTRLFTSDMSVRTVQKLCDDWHVAASTANFSGNDAIFPPPWYEGSEVNNYTITPIRSRVALFHEGRAMHNCSLTYADRVMGRSCFFYSVTKNSERVATLMICHRKGETVLGDLRAVCNEPPARKVKAAVEKWLSVNQRLYGNGNRRRKNKR